jgi:hypothetical protein
MFFKKNKLSAVKMVEKTKAQTCLDYAMEKIVTPVVNSRLSEEEQKENDRNFCFTCVLWVFEKLFLNSATESSFNFEVDGFEKSSKSRIYAAKELVGDRDTMDVQIVLWQICKFIEEKSRLNKEHLATSDLTGDLQKSFLLRFNEEDIFNYLKNIPGKIVRYYESNTDYEVHYKSSNLNTSYRYEGLKDNPSYFVISFCK